MKNESFRDEKSDHYERGKKIADKYEHADNEGFDCGLMVYFFLAVVVFILFRSDWTAVSIIFLWISGVIVVLQVWKIIRLRRALKKEMDAFKEASRAIGEKYFNFFEEKKEDRHE